MTWEEIIMMMLISLFSHRMKSSHAHTQTRNDGRRKKEYVQIPYFIYLMIKRNKNELCWLYLITTGVWDTSNYTYHFHVTCLMATNQHTRLKCMLSRCFTHHQNIGSKLYIKLFRSWRKCNESNVICVHTSDTHTWHNGHRTWLRQWVRGGRLNK